MNFNEHSAFKGMHSFLSPSQHSWLNYTEDKLIDKYTTAQAAARGTRLHEFAAEAIELGVKLPRNSQTLNMYVNDAIGYRMKPEQPLVYSINCYGTADAISFEAKKSLLRIHDLKTGTTRVTGDQLKIYAAIFCLEYKFKPFDLEYDLRVYQNDSIIQIETAPEEIIHICEKIKFFDELIESLRDND